MRTTFQFLSSNVPIVLTPSCSGTDLRTPPPEMTNRLTNTTGGILQKEKLCAPSPKKNPESTPGQLKRRPLVGDCYDM